MTDALHLLAQLAPAQAQRWAQWSGLDAAVADWLQRARAAWPQLAPADHALLEHVAARVGDDEPSVAAARLHIVDLALARACLAGEPAALRLLDELHIERLAAALRPIDPDRRFADDVLAALRIELLLGTSGRPATLSAYDGRGALWHWLRVTAVRAALKHRGRVERTSTVSDAVLEALAASPSAADAELDHLRARYRDAFRAAFVAALAGLDARDRNLLVQHHLDGVTTEQLGALYRIHRVSVSRRLAHARRTILAETRARLMHELALSAGECDSVMRLVRSQFDLTLRRIAAE